MHIVPMRYGDLCICTICGNSSRHKVTIEKCEALGVDESTQLAVGQTVQIYREVFKGRMPIGLTKDPENWEIGGVYHLQSHTLNTRWPYNTLKPHTLMIGLVQKIGASTTISIALPHRDFLLWEEGNLEKLRQAGLFPPAKK